MSQTARKPDRLGWILGLTSTAYFMVALDALVVITALPRMGADLHVGLSTLQWTVNAYGIAFAAGIITAAALGDRYGRRLVFTCGLLLFTVASVACALAPDASTLIAARTVQGLGGAVVLPLSLTILTHAFPAERRGMIVGVYGGLAGLAVAIGPLLGAAVTEGIDWHWIFWINVPIGLVAALLSTRLLPESHGPDGAFDLPGVALVTGGVVSLVWALTRANQVGWGSAETVATLAAGAALLVCFVLRERSAPAPMLPLRLLSVPAFTAGNVTAFLMSGAIFAAAFLTFQYFQLVRGYSPLATSVYLLPWLATPMIVSPIAGAVSDRIGRRPRDRGRAAAADARLRLDRDERHPRQHRRRRCRPPDRGRRHLDGAANRPHRRPRIGHAGRDRQGLRDQLHDATLRRRLRDRDRGRDLHRQRPPRLTRSIHQRLQARTRRLRDTVAPRDRGRARHRSGPARRISRARARRGPGSRLSMLHATQPQTERQLVLRVPA